jgi:hypothetical protein
MSSLSYLPGQEKTGTSFEGDKTIGAAAYKEARQLNNRELLTELFEIIRTEHDATDRHHAYFISGCIGKNTDDRESALFFIERLSHEKDVTLLKTILQGLAHLFKPLTADLDPIKKLTTHKTFLVRAAAYEALTNTEHSVEDYLHEKLKVETRNNDIQYLIFTLMYIGTSKSLDVIKTHLKSRNSGVKEAARDASILILIREGFSDDAIEKKIKCFPNEIEILRSRLNLLTRQG